MSGLFKASADPKTLRIIPLGGCGEFGMNLTGYFSQGRLFVVDCGVKFPEPYRLGVDAVVPDVDPHFREAGGVHSYIITHGHEDHIGALPHVIRRWPAPVYATAWSVELLKNKLGRIGEDPGKYNITTLEAGDRIRTEGFDVEFVHMNHSIPQTCALFIRTPQLNVFHTGDFKFDDTPLLEAPADWNRLRALGREGVDLLLADSTNAEKAGLCPGESTVLKPMTELLQAAPEAVILTTFSSNLARLKTIADAALASGRKLLLLGNGVETTFSIAKALGIYELPEDLRIEPDQVSKFPRRRLVVLATGCQGEWRAALARIANGEHKAFEARANDTVILSSRIIPGNEKAILTVMNNLQRMGVRIISAREAPGIHVSGHAYQGDLNLLHEALKPKFFAPVHGAFSQLRANLARGEQAGSLPSLVETGDVLDCSKQGVVNAGKVEIALSYLDADSGVLLSNELLRERLRVGELGQALVSGVYDKGRRSWAAPVTIDLPGLKVPEREGERWLPEMGKNIESQVARLCQGNPDPAYVTEEVRVFLRRHLTQVLKKKPIVVVKIHLI